MVTGREVFAIALALIDEVTPSAEVTREGTREYSGRAPGLLTALVGELYPYSDGFAPTGNRRGSPAPVASLDDALAADDLLCRSVLPYGLAARLVLEENPSMASFFEARYEELFAKFAPMRPTASEAIADLYGGIRGENLG